MRTIVEIVSDCDDRSSGRGLTDPTINEDADETQFDADEVIGVYIDSEYCA